MKLMFVAVQIIFFSFVAQASDCISLLNSGSADKFTTTRVAIAPENLTEAEHTYLRLIEASLKQNFIGIEDLQKLVAELSGGESTEARERGAKQGKQVKTRVQSVTDGSTGDVTDGSANHLIANQRSKNLMSGVLQNPLAGKTLTAASLPYFNAYQMVEATSQQKVREPHKQKKSQEQTDGKAQSQKVNLKLKIEPSPVLIQLKNILKIYQRNHSIKQHESQENREILDIHVFNKIKLNNHTTSTPFFVAANSGREYLVVRTDVPSLRFYDINDLSNQKEISLLQNASLSKPIISKRPLVKSNTNTGPVLQFKNNLGEQMIAAVTQDQSVNRNDSVVVVNVNKLDQYYTIKLNHGDLKNLNHFISNDGEEYLTAIAADKELIMINTSRPNEVKKLNLIESKISRKYHLFKNKVEHDIVFSIFTFVQDKVIKEQIVFYDLTSMQSLKQKELEFITMGDTDLFLVTKAGKRIFVAGDTYGQQLLLQEVEMPYSGSTVLLNEPVDHITSFFDIKEGVDKLLLTQERLIDLQILSLTKKINSVSIAIKSLDLDTAFNYSVTEESLFTFAPKHVSTRDGHFFFILGIENSENGSDVFFLDLANKSIVKDFYFNVKDVSTPYRTNDGRDIVAINSYNGDIYLIDFHRLPIQNEIQK